MRERFGGTQKFLHFHHFFHFYSKKNKIDSEGMLESSGRNDGILVFSFMRRFRPSADERAAEVK